MRIEINTKLIHKKWETRAWGPRFCRSVRAEGLEPPCLAALDPKSSASANFATPAKMERKGIFFRENCKDECTNGIGQIAFLWSPHPRPHGYRQENCPLSMRHGEGAKWICDKQICLGVRQNSVIVAHNLPIKQPNTGNDLINWSQRCKCTFSILPPSR